MTPKSLSNLKMDSNFTELAANAKNQDAKRTIASASNWVLNALPNANVLNVSIMDQTVIAEAILKTCIKVNSRTKTSTTQTTKK